MDTRTSVVGSAFSVVVDTLLWVITDVVVKSDCCTTVTSTGYDIVIGRSMVVGTVLIDVIVWPWLTETTV